MRKLCVFDKGFPGGASGKEPDCQFRRHKRCGFNPCIGKIPSLEEDLATHSSILIGRISWTEEPGQSTVHRVTKSQTPLKQRSMQAHRCVVN